MRLITVTLAAGLTAGICFADVNIEQKTQFHLQGAVGALVNAFSRTAREGATSTTIVKGDRKLTRTGDSGEIIDLNEEKVYMIDFARKTYTVKTFDQIRKEYEDAKERARKRADRDQKDTSSAEKNEGPEYEVEFSARSTGNKEVINGFNTHEEIVTVTVHEKGKTIEKAGGWILTNDMWMGPKIAAMSEIYQFDRRYAQKIYGTTFLGEMQAAAMAMAATPAFGKAMKAFSDKRGSFEGTAIRTNMKFDVVAGTDPSTQQASQQQEQPHSVSGAVMGGLFNKMKERREQKKADEGGDPNRSTLLDSSMELTKASTTATAEDVAIPAGFRQR